MTLPVSPSSISMSQINTELALVATSKITLNDGVVRMLLGKPSGAISLRDGYGKANKLVTSIQSNIKNLNLYTYLTNLGWNGASEVELTIDTNVYIWSDSTSVYALDTGGAYPGGLKIINKGYIMGKGGDGEGMTMAYGTTLATSGGAALNLTASINIDNQIGYIAGGGGGGAAGYGGLLNGGGGGGAGGGTGGSTWQGYGTYFPPGGIGGAPGQSGGSGTGQHETGTGKTTNDGGGAGGAGGSVWIFGTAKAHTADDFYGGGGGGRIIPGTGGIHRTVDTTGQALVLVCWGGDGGSGGAAGSLGDLSGVNAAGGGGGGWGATGGGGWDTSTSGGYLAKPGGIGGKAVNLNGETVTWTGGFPTARVFGAVS